MKDVELIRVIRTYLLLRGNGKDIPFRRIEQFWSLDGKLLAENDPADEPTNSIECKGCFEIEK